MRNIMRPSMLSHIGFQSFLCLLFIFFSVVTFANDNLSEPILDWESSFGTHALTIEMGLKRALRYQRKKIRSLEEPTADDLQLFSRIRKAYNRFVILQLNAKSVRIDELHRSIGEGGDGIELKKQNLLRRLEASIKNFEEILSIMEGGADEDDVSQEDADNEPAKTDDKTQEPAPEKEEADEVQKQKNYAALRSVLLRLQQIREAQEALNQDSSSERQTRADAQGALYRSLEEVSQSLSQSGQKGLKDINRHINFAMRAMDWAKKDIERNQNRYAYQNQQQVVYELKKGRGASFGTIKKFGTFPDE